LKSYCWGRDSAGRKWRAGGQDKAVAGKSTVPRARNKELEMPYVMVVMAGLVVALAMVFVVL
jgi:hypothetical protein